MKPLIYTLLIISALACGTWAWCNSRDAKTAELRLQAQKKQAAANEASAKAMEAKEKKEAEQLRKEASVKELAAKTAARDEAKHKAEEAKADERAMVESRKKAEAEAKIAEDNRKIAADKAAAEKDRRAAAEAAVKYAEVTNDMRQAELKIASEKRCKAEADRKAKEAALEVEKLKKADYDKLRKDVEALEAILREREEATRPARTLKDLLADNEVEPAAQEPSPEEIKEHDAAESNRLAKISRRQEPRTSGDDAIAAAEARLGSIAAKYSKAVREKARARLEALASKAEREGRKDAANSYRLEVEKLFDDDLGKAEPE